MGSVVSDVDILDASVIDDARRVLRDWVQPLDPAALAKALAVMKVSTAHRNMDEVDLDLQIEVYADAMRQYPADVATALLRQPRKWFPTLYELTEEAEQMSAARRKIANALK